MGPSYSRSETMTYTNSLELWKSLGKNSYYKVRDEAVGTGNGTTSAWDVAKDNLITDSTTFYDGGVEVTSSYILDLDDGKVTGLTASGALTADYSYADIPDSHIQEILNRADEYITDSTGRSFAKITTTEYLDVEDRNQDEYFLSQYPVSTISSLQANESSTEGDEADWKTKTQGIGNDFISNTEDLKHGRIRLIDNFPATKGKDRLKITYVYGYDTVPKLVQGLAILLAQRELIQSTIYQTIFKGRDNSSPISLDVVDARIEDLTRKLKRIDISKP